MTQNAYDIAIVGAGMVGAAIACGLAPTGLRIAILDRTPPPPFDANQAPDIRVSALSYASEQILRNLGAWQFISAMRTCPYQRMGVTEKLDTPLTFAGAPLNQTLFDSTDIGYPYLGHIVENNITQLGLHQAMAQHHNIDILCPSNIQSIDFDTSLPTVFYSQSSESDKIIELNAKLIIGADGALSKVRDWASIGMNSSQYEQQALVATVEYQGSQQDITWQAFTSSGPLAFLPLMDVNEKHYGSLVWYDHPDKIRQLMAQDSQTFMAEVAKNFPSQLPPLIQLLNKGSFTLVKRHAQDYIGHRVALAGDAAHTINPLAGQGVNLGFQDAATLIEVITEAHMQGKDIGLASHLQAYERLRKIENKKMMEIMDLFYHMFSNDHAPLKVLRNIGLGLADKLPFGKKKVIKYAMGLEGNLPKLARPA
ncbi:FAD-dependent monooxygenase [Alkalimarinus sediminis]|uniref:FAD-dependent monooxygenase n=1 Tax=Alkalimarinus sediminis TaxID=1632866 RepID=A0A9E8KNT1_9ALTE|nr:FAD-dependent monooxygenase [Alkalimarinus sediminis]UZW73999.1 FAD-dependent monooxygenase [Alkalimarinus sediminis]